MHRARDDDPNREEEARDRRSVEIVKSGELDGREAEVAMTVMEEHPAPEQGRSRWAGRGAGPRTIWGHSLGGAAVGLGAAVAVVLLEIFGAPW